MDVVLQGSVATDATSRLWALWGLRAPVGLSLGCRAPSWEVMMSAHWEITHYSLKGLPLPCSSGVIPDGDPSSHESGAQSRAVIRSLGVNTQAPAAASRGM